MKFSYGVEVEGMALEKDYNHIKNFLRFSDENYFITGDESIKISENFRELYRHIRFAMKLVYEKQEYKFLNSSRDIAKTLMPESYLLSNYS